MKLLIVLSLLMQFSLQSICAATPVTAISATPAATTTTTKRTERMGNNFLLSDFPFMVEIKIFKYEILLCTKIGGFISKRWIIITSYYEDNTPYLIFEILSPDYPRAGGINTTKYFPYPKLLEHGDFVNNIALLDMGCDVTENYIMLSHYGVNWPNTLHMYKLQKFIEDDIVQMDLVKFDTTQKCHGDMYELCYDTIFESNTGKNMVRHLTKDTFYIHFDINNSPVLIGIQTASQRQRRQQQHQQQPHFNDRKCNRFLNIMYFWKWICAVTGIN